MNCHPQTDCFVVSQLFSMTRHVRCFKPGLKSGWWHAPGQACNSMSELRINAYVSSFIYFTFCAIGCKVFNFFRRALHYVSGNCYIPLPECSTPLGVGSIYICMHIYIYIYIYIYVKKYFLVWVQREKKVNISKWMSPLKDLYFLRIIYFVRTYLYVSSLMLSSENMWHKTIET